MEFPYLLTVLLAAWLIASGVWLYKSGKERVLAAREAKAVQQLRPLTAFTRVAANPESGRTVFATETIPAFAALGIYDGAHVKQALFLKKERRLKGMPIYHWKLPGGTVVDPTEADGSVPDDTEYRSALINEPPPGVAVNILPLATKKNVWLFAAREIKEGEELFMNYGTGYQRDYESEMERTAGRVALDSQQVDALVRIAQERPYLRQAVAAFLPDDYRASFKRLKNESMGGART